MSGTIGPVDIRFQPEAWGRTRVDVFVGDISVSHCGIVPFIVRVGRANVPVNGIDDVWTEEEHRDHGYARQLLESTVHHMRTGDAALSILYGISDFYPKFGYATVGFDFGIRLNELDRLNRIPDGWTVRAFVPDDLETIRHVYERATVGTVGPAIRSPESSVWNRLAACADPRRQVWEPFDGSTAPPARDECRVAIGPGGDVAAYFWRGKGLNYVNLDERYFPTGLCIGEVVADSPLAADTILFACRAFAIEESTRLEAEGNAPYRSIRLGVQPDSAVAAAAQFRAAWSISYSWDCGGPMARVLDLGRLFVALKPELDERFCTSHVPFRGTLHLRTDLGSVLLGLTDSGVSISTAPERAAGETGELRVELPQTAVARLALGGFPPRELLARLDLPVDGMSTKVLAALFPQRHPYLYLADRP